MTTVDKLNGEESLNRALRLMEEMLESALGTMHEALELIREGQAESMERVETGTEMVSQTRDSVIEGSQNIVDAIENQS